MLLIYALATALAAFPTGIYASPLSLPQLDIAGNVTRSLVTGIDARAPQPSSYPLEPGPYPNEFKYLNFDPSNSQDKDDLQKIHAVFAGFRAMAADALQLIQNNDQTVIERWYGASEPVSELEGVFANMYDKDSGQPTTIVSQMVCDHEDFDNACTPLTNAYTRPETGKFHICPFGHRKKQNSEILCTDLDPSCSKQMRSLSMVLLHEMTHYDQIGEAARGGFPIIDEARGAHNCFTLPPEGKADNAQNYAWLVGEAYWGNFCSKTFEDPKPGVH